MLKEKRCHCVHKLRKMVCKGFWKVTADWLKGKYCDLIWSEDHLPPAREQDSFMPVLYVTAALFLHRQLHIFVFPNIWRAPVWPYFLMNKSSVTKHKDYADVDLLIKLQTHGSSPAVSFCMTLNSVACLNMWVTKTHSKFTVVSSWKILEMLLIFSQEVLWSSTYERC